MSLKVEFLLKQELQYELHVRGIEFNVNENVNELRKLLRAAIKINVSPNPYNLAKKITLSEEVQTITVNLQSLENKILDLADGKDINSFIRAEIKINHYESRLKNLSKFSLDAEQKVSVDELTNKLKTIRVLQ
jgi:hypothetical protein